MDLCGLTSTVSSSPFKTVFGHFVIWWLYHLVGCGQQVHAFSDPLLLYGAVASVIPHTSSQLLTDFEYVSSLVSSQKSAPWWFPVQLRHFTRPASCSILPSPSLAIPSWRFPSSLATGCFSSFRLRILNPCFHHTEFCPTSLVMFGIAFEFQSEDFTWIFIGLKIWPSEHFLAWVVLKFLDLFGMLTFFALLTLEDVRVGIRWDTMMKIQLLVQRFVSVCWCHLCFHWWIFAGQIKNILSLIPLDHFISKEKKNRSQTFILFFTRLTLVQTFVLQTIKMNGILVIVLLKLPHLHAHWFDAGAKSKGWMLWLKGKLKVL